MNRQDLVQKLELVGRALASTNLIPIFTCFCFDQTTVSAYDDSIGIIAPCETGMSFAVNGATLLGLLKNSNSEEVEFKLDGPDLVIKAGRSNFKLPYQTKDEFLFKEPEDKWDDIQIPIVNGVPKGVSSCLLTSSKDQSQSALMCVALNGGSLYSCNGDALTRFVLPDSEGTVPTHPLYTMPNEFCETLLKLHVEITYKEAGQLEFQNGWVRALMNGGYVVYGRLIENDHPLDHEALIKKTLKSEPTYVAIPEGLDHALSRARVVADPESKPTQLTVEGGKLRLLTDTHLGTVRDVLPFKHPDVQALVSAELLQRSISLCTEIAVMENCVCTRSGDELFVLLSNYG